MSTMVEVLLAQGLSKEEAYKRVSSYYQMLSEGCSRVEARQAFRTDASFSHLKILVSSAIRSIIDKGYQPEEVEDAIYEYYHPSKDCRRIGFIQQATPTSLVSDNSLDEEEDTDEGPGVYPEFPEKDFVPDFIMGEGA